MVSLKLQKFNYYELSTWRHNTLWTQRVTSSQVVLIAQLVEHYTGIAEVICSNPVQAWILFFFKALLNFTTAEVVCNCDDNSGLLKLFAYVNTFFCSHKFTWLLDTWVKTFYTSISPQVKTCFIPELSILTPFWEQIYSLNCIFIKTNRTTLICSKTIIYSYK